jgi:hypothetical protein
MKRASFGLKLLGEFVGFARENRVYWIVPLLLALALIAGIVVTSEVGAPLIYTLF